MGVASGNGDDELDALLQNLHALDLVCEQPFAADAGTGDDELLYAGLSALWDTSS